MSPSVAVPTGLCGACAHQRIVRTGRGSEFSLCERHRTEPETYPKYPRLPVIACPGYDGSGSSTRNARAS